MQAALASLGPPPFQFTPSQRGSGSQAAPASPAAQSVPAPALRCAAFSLPFKLLATVLVGGAMLWLVLLFTGSIAGANPRSSSMLWFAAAMLLMLTTWWYIVTGTTTLSSEALQQSWVWNKKMELRELAYGKLIRVRGLDWLIAPRLYVRTLMGKFAVFYAADALMLSDFERLVKELAAFRKMR